MVLSTQRQVVKKSTYTNPMDKDCVSPILAGIDSFSALGMDSRVVQDVLDQSNTPQMAEHSRKMGKYLQDRAHRFKQCQALMMIAAQEKARIKTGMNKGGPDKTSLGDAPIGFHSTYSVDLTAYSYRDDGGNDIGERVNLWTSKNKLSPKHRSLDLYLVRDHGFDLIKTDADFLLKHNASPFTKEDAYRHGHGITCRPLSDKPFKTDEDFLMALYANKDFLMSVRERMRIRGFGFDFEQKYIPTPEEVEDNAISPKGASELHGVEGSEKPVPPETIVGGTEG